MKAAGKFTTTMSGKMSAFEIGSVEALENTETSQHTQRNFTPKRELTELFCSYYSTHLTLLGIFLIHGANAR